MSTATAEKQKIEPLELERWVPNPDKPGYLKFDRMITYRELITAVKNFLKTRGHDDKLDYACLGSTGDQKLDQQIARYHWCAVYAVTGGSEGHYIHVDLIRNDESRELVILAKTFDGMTTAYEIAHDLAVFLYA